MARILIDALGAIWDADMRYLSVCSGLESASVAFAPLGWQCVGLAEIDKHARALLMHRFPNVPLYGDFREIKGDEFGPVDVLIGGPPCQSYSIAGKRGGRNDARGNLIFDFAALAARVRARHVLFENVPGLLSDDEGRTFGAFLQALADGGFGVAYRVLDALSFGIPQLRRRVFVVGCAGADVRRAGSILFERQSLCRNPFTSGEAREIASALTANGVGAGGGADDNAAQARHLVPVAFGDSEDASQSGMIAHTLRADGFDASEDGTGRGTPLVVAGTTSPSGAGTARTGNARSEAEILIVTETGKGFWSESDVATTIRKGDENGNGGARESTLVAFALRGREEGSLPEVCDGGDTVGSLRAASGGSSRDYIATVFDPTQITSRENRSRPEPGGPCHTINAHAHAHAHAPVLAFTCKDSGSDAGSVSPTLPAMTNRHSTPNGGGQVAVAFDIYNQSVSNVSPTLRDPNGTFGDALPAVAIKSAVRRITPTEAERLQALPDGWTLVPLRTTKSGKVVMMSDGARYKMIGNAFSSAPVRWIGERIAIVDSLASQEGAA